MKYEETLRSIAEDLRAGKPAIPVSVREMLSWFDAQRRGYTIVNSIRDALATAGLQTEPDFESAFIDSEITFVLASAQESPVGSVGDLAVTPPSGSLSMASGSSAAVPTRQSDPTYRISKLKAANTTLTTVTPNTTANEAVTLMLTNDFSQVPVMQGERDVKGVVSWQSIGTRLALDRAGPYAKDLMDSAQIIQADSSIFNAIPIIAQHQYVLIRGADNRITGIVTSSDLNFQFQQLAEPFLLLGEIENHIRKMIDGKISNAELEEARDPSDPNRVVESVSDLSFGEYIRLVENPGRWEKLRLGVDRNTFCKNLENVRRIRNDVMHFDPDNIPAGDLDKLRDFVRFLQTLQNVGIT